MNEKKGYPLYNMLFPIWLLWLFPVTWLFILPGNFLIDLLVLMLTMKYLQVPGIKKLARTLIFRTWIYGFAADFVGVFLMCLVDIPVISDHTPFGKWWNQQLHYAVLYNPFSSIFGFLWTTVCVLASGYVIYRLNVRYFRKKPELTDNQSKKMALSLAVFTAPWLFYFPTGPFYGW